jgi:subtilisin family serine protease
MYRVAQEEQKRLVINMSWGLYWMDNFDGTGPVGQKMRELSDLGVVFVTSGGNNGDEQFHLGHTFNNDTLRSRFMFPADNNSPYYWGTSLSMTNSPGKPFSVSFIWCNNQYQTIDASPFYHTADGDNYTEGYLTNGTDTIIYNVEVIESDESGRPEARVRVKKPANLNSNWRLGIAVAAAEGDFHAWNVAELTSGVGNWGGKWMGVNALGWKYGDSQYGTGTPACVDCAITVAAHQSGSWEDDVWHPGDICSFSSYGPTINGRDKPDISAPGYNVISANSSYADEHNTPVTTVTFEGREYSFIRLSGTSMSSPFTTGVVALLLEANPTLTAQQVKESLIFSATHDSLTEARGMVRFGHGKVNAYQAVLRALYHVGTQDFVSTANIYTLFPNPATDQLFISTPNNQEATTAYLYDLNGRLLQTMVISQGVNTMALGSLPNGTYILKIANAHFTESKKVVIAR